MKKLLAMLLIFSMLLAFLASCYGSDISSSSSEEPSQQSSTREDGESSADEPITGDNSFPTPYLEKTEYYTIIAHDKLDFGTSARTGNHFNYMVFWKYEDYASSLSATVDPIVDKEFFEDNIVIYIDNPDYQREIKDLEIGFRDFYYSRGKIEITLDVFPWENANFDYYDYYDAPFIASTYIAIPKTAENGLGSYSINRNVEIELKTHYLGAEHVAYSIMQEGKPISFYEEEKLWLIKNAEDYDAFIKEECDVFNGALGNPLNDLPGIIHYSPCKYQNSFLQVYENVHIHEDGTVYVEHKRFFDEEREEPDGYEPVYTYVSLENSDIDLSRASGKVVCEDYDYVISQGVIEGKREPQAETKYYKEVILEDGITAYNPPDGYIDGYYNVFYLFKTVEELKEFGFTKNLSYYDIDINDYYYLISSRSYYNREYVDIGFSNLRIEDGVPKIDLYQASAVPNGESENLSLILIPREELPNGISAEDIQINYVTEKYLDELVYVGHVGKTDKAEIGRGFIYTNLGSFFDYNGRIKDPLRSETSPLAATVSFDEVNVNFFEENIIVVIERSRSSSKNKLLGYKDAKVVDGTLVITATLIYTADKMEELYEESTWDDQIVIPRAMLGNAEINSNTPVKIQLEVKHQTYDMVYERIEDALE